MTDRVPSAEVSSEQKAAQVAELEAEIDSMPDGDEKDAFANLVAAIRQVDSIPNEGSK